MTASPAEQEETPCDPCGFRLLLDHYRDMDEVRAAVDEELAGEYEAAHTMKAGPYCVTRPQFDALANNTNEGMILIASELVFETQKENPCTDAFTIIPSPTGLSLSLRD